MNVKRRSPFFHSIRFQLLVSVNGVVFLMLAALLSFDYQRELAAHFGEKKSALKDEARTLLPSVIHLQRHGRDAIQEYVDDVCGRMEDADSPGHHIAVEIGGDLIQANSHHRASTDLGSTMKAATTKGGNQILHEDQELIVGTQSQGNTSVYVSENVTRLRNVVFMDGMIRMSGMLLVGLVAAAIMNVVLIRLVSRPLQQLVDQVRSIGLGRFDTQNSDFGNTELSFLSSEINAMSASLAASERSMRMSMDKAREIQENLLPDDIRISGLEIAKIYSPADEVGGDYFDILPHGDDCWLVCVADASGHGVPAAMSAAMLKMLLLQTKDRSESPAEILREMNRVFMQVHLYGDFATLILLRIDLNSGRLVYANAGHDPAWILHSTGGVQELAATGTPLGIIEDEEWEERTLVLAEKSRLVLSTDGITEAFDAQELAFGRERLLKEIMDLANLSVVQTVARIDEQVTKYRGQRPQSDDITMLVIDIATNTTTGSSALASDSNCQASVNEPPVSSLAG